MIKTKKDLKDFLSYEKKKYFRKNINLIKYLFLRNISEKVIIWRFQKTLRKYEYYLNSKKLFMKNIYKIKYMKLKNKYGLHISPNTFDRGLKIMHIGSIMVNDRAKIGKDCSIHVNTAIAAGGRTDNAPIIGDNCVIGIGSILIGEIKIGNNCAIGAGAVVNKSFEDGNCTIAGVPAKIISLNTSNDWNKNRE